MEQKDGIISVQKSQIEALEYQLNKQNHSIPESMQSPWWVLTTNFDFWKNSILAHCQRPMVRLKSPQWNGLISRRSLAWMRLKTRRKRPLALTTWIYCRNGQTDTTDTKSSINQKTFIKTHQDHNYRLFLSSRNLDQLCQAQSDPYKFNTPLFSAPPYTCTQTHFSHKFISWLD